MTKPHGLWARRLLPMLALVVAACSGDANVIGPDNQLEVTNATDSFQWQVSALSDVTQVLAYSWVNTGPSAAVNQSSSLGSGAATLEITDATGVLVYGRSLSDNGTYTTMSGVAGTWTITVSLDQAQGTLNFRVQKP